MEQSTIHLTQSGKKCKKCLQRGGPCHLHGGSPSPKKTSPKSVSSTVAWLSDLPQPALYKVLLDMNPTNLNAACRTHPSAAKICTTKRFQEEYKKKHGTRNLIEGKLVKIPGVKQKGLFREYIDHLFIDEAGNGIEVQISKGKKNAIKKLKYIPNFSEKGLEYMILGKTKDGKHQIRFEKDYYDLKGEKLRQFLKKLGKEYWLDEGINYEAVFKTFLRSIRKASGFKKLYFEKLHI